MGDKLEQELIELKEASERTREDRAPRELDQTTVGRLSRMDSMQMQAVAIAQEEHRQTRIRRIVAAIARADAGELGACARCGEEIEEKRMLYDPSTPLCLECAS